jgi:hypothetical protein
MTPAQGRRVARNPEEPAKSGPAGAERWADYLDWPRRAHRRGAGGARHLDIVVELTRSGAASG